MRLKDGLILRKVAGQYVVVPTGRRVQEITSMVYISSSAAFLWNYMKDRDFTREDLVEQILGEYVGVTREEAAADIDAFLQVLQTNSILVPEEDQILSGSVYVRVPDPRPEREKQG